jgi:hypothetical protein
MGTYVLNFHGQVLYELPMAIMSVVGKLILRHMMECISLGMVVYVIRTGITELQAE